MSQVHGHEDAPNALMWVLMSVASWHLKPKLLPRIEIQMRGPTVSSVPEYLCDLGEADNLNLGFLSMMILAPTSYDHWERKRELTQNRRKYVYMVFPEYMENS